MLTDISLLLSSRNFVQDKMVRTEIICEQRHRLVNITFHKAFSNESLTSIALGILQIIKCVATTQPRIASAVQSKFSLPIQLGHTVDATQARNKIFSHLTRCAFPQPKLITLT